MSMSGRAKLAGVVGDPISQSLSPRLHAHWLATCGIDGVYAPLLVARHDFAFSLNGLRKAGFVGVNVTVPHKEAAFALADRHDAAARATGAANLLLFHDDHIEGRNTDAVGLAASLIEKLGADALRNKPIAILGSGGAARGAVLAATELGAAEIRIVARNQANAQALARDVHTASAAPLRLFTWQDWHTAAAGIALLVNATSAGMHGTSALDIGLDPLPRDAAVCDIVYNPLETDLLAKARARGHVVVDGLGMLMHQAAPSFEAFYGTRPSITAALRRHLEAVLHGN